MEEISLIFSSKIRSVKIFTGMYALQAISKIINDNYSSKVVITNKTIWKIWKNYFEENIKDFFVYQIDDGEKYKNYKTISKIYEFLLNVGATRKTALIGFGGGVVGDITGFVASTYHRGVPLIHIPTTLLAQIDSSIGGKTGYNLKEGKNLIGTFYQPHFIISDSIFIDTLSEKEYKSGLAEAIKAACIMDYRLFELIDDNKIALEKREKEVISEIIKRSQKVKIHVVKEDEEETGIRSILNFGHTLGHSIEKLKKWRISHGFAVAAGMGFATYLSYSMGFISKEDMIRVLNLLKFMGYKLFYPVDFSSLERVILMDKKRKDKHVEWVLLKEIGHAVYGVKLDLNYVLEMLKSYRKFLR